MKRHAASFSFLALLSTQTTWAEETPPTETSSVAQEGVDAASSGQNADPAEDSENPGGSALEDPESEAPESEGMEIDWKGPLKLFDLGQVEEALASLRKQVLECGEPEEEKCTAPQFATLYGSIAVVLAGSGDHDGGVRAFRRALTFTEVRLLPAYRTPEIERALAEARGEPIAAPPSTTAAPQPVSPSVPVDEAAPKPIQGKAFLMLSGLGQVGLLSGGGASFGILRLGGALTLASRTGEGSFALGLRGTGGTLVGNAALGTFGGRVLMGGMGIPRYRNRFGFVLGGLGIEYAPAVQSSMVAIDFLLGRALGGGTVALSVHSGFNAYEYINTIGIEVGVGGLSKAK